MADSLDTGDQAYLAECRSLEDERRDRELRQARDLAEARDREALAQRNALLQARQSTKRIRTALVVVLALALVSGVTAWFAVAKRREAETANAVAKQSANEAMQSAERLSHVIEQASMRALGRALQAEEQGNEPARYAYIAESLSLHPLQQAQDIAGTILQGKVTKVDGSIPVHSGAALRSYAISPSGSAHLEVRRNGELIVAKPAAIQATSTPLVTDVVQARWCTTEECLIAHVSDKTVRILDPSGRELRKFGVEGAKEAGIVVSDNGEAAAYVDGGVLQLVDPGNPNGVVLAQSSDEFSISFSRNAQNLSFQERNRIRVWTLGVDEPKLVFDHSAKDSDAFLYTVLAFSDNGRWFAYVEDGSISIVDLADGSRTRPVEHFDYADAGGEHVEFTKDSSKLIVVWSGNWRYPGEVWVVRDLSTKPSVVRHEAESEISTYSVHPISKQIVFESLGSCQALDLEKRAPPYKIETCPDSVRHVEYSPDGRWLLAASGDFFLKLWADGFKQVGAPLRRSYGGSVEVSPAGDWFIERSNPEWDQSSVRVSDVTLWPTFDESPIPDLAFDGNAGTVIRTAAGRVTIDATPETLQEALVGISGYRIADDGRLESLGRDALMEARTQLMTKLALGAHNQDEARDLITWHLSVPRERRIAPTSVQTVAAYLEELELVAMSGRTDLRGDILTAAEDLYLVDPTHPVVLMALASMTEDDALASLWLTLAMRRSGYDGDQLTRLMKLARALKAPKAVFHLATTVAARSPNNKDAAEQLAWASLELTRPASEAERCLALAEADLPSEAEVFNRILQRPSIKSRRLAIAEDLSSAQSTLLDLDRCLDDGDPGRIQSVTNSLTSKRSDQISIESMLQNLQFTGEDEADSKVCGNAAHDIAFGWGMDDAGRIADLTGRRAYELAKAACPDLQHPLEDM